MCGQKTFANEESTMEEKSPAQRIAEQQALEAGQSAFRDGKSLKKANPYPPGSPFHDLWEQGWREEHDLHLK